MKSAHIIVHGRVQKVSFRYFTNKQANKLGLSGWVRNKPDGTVEIEAEGEETMINTLIHWCREKGSPNSQIDHIDVVTKAASRTHGNFSIL